MRLRPWVFAVLMTGFSSSLVAQPVPPARYRVDRFTSEQELPGHQIYDIEQTADGYLWVATNAGLARYDGHRFTVITADTLLLPTKAVTSLYLHAGDTLFAATKGGVLRYDEGAFAPYAAIDYAASVLGSLGQDREGRFWGTYSNDLLREDQGHFELAILDLTSYVGDSRQLFVDGNGEVWLPLWNEADRTPYSARSCYAIEEAQPRLARLEQDRPVPQGPTLYPYLITYPAQAEVLFASRQGAAIAFTNPQRELRGRFRLPKEACPLLIDRQGYLWAKEGAALVTYAPEEDEPVSRIEIGLRPQPRVFPDLFEDREGNLWIGTFSQGLIRIRRNLFQVYGTAQGIKQAQVTTMIGGVDGSILVKDRTGAVYRLNDRRVQPLLDRVQGFYEDEDGTLLYSRENRPGSPVLVRRSQAGEQILGETPFEGGTLNHHIYADPQDNGVYWTHTYTTVYRLDAPAGVQPELTRVLEGLTNVRQLFKDRAGILWVATGEGLYRLEGQHVTRFTTADGLPVNHLRAIHQDPDGVLWFGTYGGGLVRYQNGRFQTVDERHGLAENVVSTILEDEHGYFWMSGNQGIHRAQRSQLNALLDGERASIIAVQYGRESGLLNPEASGLPGLKAADGRLWFPTFGGAAVVDPGDALRRGREPPIVNIQAVLINDQPVSHRGTVQLVTGQRRFEIAYVGLNLRNPDGVRYRYLLDGFDDDWIEAGTARRATYTNVTPGTHTFRVQARNDAGLWSEQDATLTLTVAPFFYETWWFYALCTLIVLGLVFGGYRVRIQREKELSRLVKERTHELAREKETVAAQAEELRSLDTAKSHFFANISHEFRTPLTLILGPLEDMQDGLHGPVTGSGQRQINTAIHNGRRLLRLVNQLLDVSRLESGKIDLQVQERDMHAFVKNLVHVFVPLAEHNHIAFRYEGPGHPLPVYFDKEQFEKVLANLLGNAFKFTPEHGTVLVTLGTEEAEGSAGTMVLTVRDSGPGIAPEHVSHIFERFYQADASSTRQQAGTGIGLALVKNLVDLHRGTVEVESTVGLGTTFTVRLPLGPAHLRPEEIVPPDADGDILNLNVLLEKDLTATFIDEMQGAPMDAEKPPRPDNAASHADDATTILVVDDNPEVRAYVRRHLASRYRVLEATNGREALDKTREHLPDLVVSDVMMPEMDGFGLCRAIKEDPELDFIPVILLTAKASIDNKIEGLEKGADDYLTKPFNMRELEVRAENMIASRQRLKARFAGASHNTLAGSPRPIPVPLTDDNAAFVEQVHTEILVRLSDDDFGVDALAAAVGLGRTTLYSRLAEAFGQTPMELIWQMRLEQAATLLRQQEGSVSEVAYGVGFKSVAHFCHRFRDRFGCTPATYTARHTSESA